MALIPSKSKVSTFSTDSFSFGTMMIILCVVMIGSHIVDEFFNTSYFISCKHCCLSFISQ